MHSFSHFWRVWFSSEVFEWGVRAQVSIGEKKGGKVRIFFLQFFLKNLVDLGRHFNLEF